MAKKKEKRLGSDPLKWITSSGKESSDKPSLSNDDNSSKPSKQGNISKSDKPGKQSNTNNIGKSDNQDKIDNTNKPDNNQEDWVRATFIIKRSHVEKMKSIGYWDRKQIKEVLCEALDSFFAGKDIKPIPKK